MLLTLCFSVGVMTSCSDDDDEPQTDNGTAVAGTYSGRLSYGTTIVEDAYIVTISRVTSSVVTVYAGFLDKVYDEGLNCNVSQSNGTYTLVNEAQPNISITVYGNTINISYLTGGGLMYTFNGQKD